MKHTSLILISILIATLSSCIPGDLIEPEKSNSYYKRLGKIYYSPSGNWFELGYDKCNADVNSFKVLSESIAKDNNAIFSGYKIQNQVDYNSFRIDSNDVPEDKNYVYEIGYLNELKPVEIKGIDVESFEYIGKGRQSAYGWTKDKNHYYFKQKIVNAHYETLKFLTEDFYFDKDSLYTDLNDWKIKTIKEISQPPLRLNEEYIISDSILYYVGTDENRKTELKKIKVASRPFDIRIVSRNVISIDNLVVYYGKPMDKFDANTLVLISDSEIGSFMKYYKDRYYVYLDTMIIENADPESFKVMELGFSKDDKHVYYMRNTLKGVDAKSFRKVPKEFNEWIDKHGNRFNSNGEEME